MLKRGSNEIVPQNSYRVPVGKTLAAAFLSLLLGSGAWCQSVSFSVEGSGATIASLVEPLPVRVRVYATAKVGEGWYVDEHQINGRDLLGGRSVPLGRPVAMGEGWFDFVVAIDVRAVVNEGANAGHVRIISPEGGTTEAFSFFVDTVPPQATIVQHSPLRYAVSDGGGSGIKLVRPWVVTADGRFEDDRPTVVRLVPGELGAATVLEVNRNASRRWDGSLIDLFDGAGHRLRIVPSGRTESAVMAEATPPPALPVIPADMSAGASILGDRCRFERVDVVAFFNSAVEQAAAAEQRLGVLASRVMTGLEDTEEALKAHRYDLGASGIRPDGNAVNKRTTGYSAAQISQGNLPVTFATPEGQVGATLTQLDIDNVTQMGRLRAHVQGLSISANPKTLVLVAVDELRKGGDRAPYIGLAYGGPGDGFIVIETGRSARRFTFHDEVEHTIVHELGHLMGLDHVDQTRFSDPAGSNVLENYMTANMAVQQTRLTLRQATRFIASLCGASPLRLELNQNPHAARKVYSPAETFTCNNGLSGFDEETESTELLNGKRCLDGGPMPPVESSSGNPRPEARSPNGGLDERWCWCFGQYSTHVLGRAVNGQLVVPSQSEDRVRAKNSGSNPSRPGVIDLAFHDSNESASIYGSKNQVSESQYANYIRRAERRIALRLAPDEQLLVKTAVQGNERRWTIEIWAPSRPTIDTGITFTRGKDETPYTLILRTDTAQIVTTPAQGTGYFAPGR